MNGLRHLSLEGLNITDDGLLRLQAMTTLRTINVRKTNVTKRGIEVLSAALPMLLVHWDGEEENTKREERNQLHVEAFLNRFEDQYRLKLLEYQKRYFGFSVHGEELVGSP